MSIIYDALKKVEGKFQDSERISRNVNTANPAHPEAGRKHKAADYQRLWVILLVMFFGSLSAALAFNYFTALVTKKESVPLANPLKPLPDVRDPLLMDPPQQAIKAGAIKTQNLPGAPLIQKPLPLAPTMILNGIFFSQEEGYALINNQIVKAGDTVGAYRVAKIAVNEVDLVLGDETVKLVSAR